MTKDNRQCLFKERYTFNYCVNCSGYGSTRIKECQHYLPIIELEKHKAVDIPVRNLDDIRRIADSGVW